jgi:hypothetical protein
LNENDLAAYTWGLMAYKNYSSQNQPALLSSSVTQEFKLFPCASAVIAIFA